MHRIRTITLALVLVAGTTVAARAQEQPATQQGGQGRGRGMGAAQLLQGITLTAEQQAKVDTIQAAFAPKVQAAREEARAARQAGGDASESMKKMQGVNAELFAALKAVLTTEQQVVFEKNREAQDARRREMMQNRPPTR